MVQLITNIGIDFPSGINVSDIVRAMIKDNWPTTGDPPIKQEIRFTDIGHHGNTNYQISTRQLPYKILRTSGTGAYQHIMAPVELNAWQRKVSLTRPLGIDTMINRISDIVQTNQRDMSLGMQAGILKTLASGMIRIVSETEFDEPGLDTIRVNLPKPTSSIMWHSQSFVNVEFARYIQ